MTNYLMRVAQAAARRTLPIAPAVAPPSPMPRGAIYRPALENGDVIDRASMVNRPHAEEAHAVDAHHAASPLETPIVASDRSDVAPLAPSKAIDQSAGGTSTTELRGPIMMPATPVPALRVSESATASSGGDQRKDFVAAPEPLEMVHVPRVKLVADQPVAPGFVGTPTTRIRMPTTLRRQEAASEGVRSMTSTTRAQDSRVDAILQSDDKVISATQPAASSTKAEIGPSPIPPALIEINEPAEIEASNTALPLATVDRPTDRPASVVPLVADFASRDETSFVPATLGRDVTSAPRRTVSVGLPARFEPRPARLTIGRIDVGVHVHTPPPAVVPPVRPVKHSPSNVFEQHYLDRFALRY